MSSLSQLIARKIFYCSVYFTKDVEDWLGFDKFEVFC